jgi:hypothetical protein
MTTGTLIPALIYQGYTSNGSLNAFGTLATYAAGSTTPLATFQDPGLTQPNLNPVQLNAIGQANIWLTPGLGYKFIEFDQLGNQCGYQDQVNASGVGITSNVVPGLNNTFNIGSPAFTWANGYFGTAVYIGGISVFPQPIAAEIAANGPTGGVINKQYPVGHPWRYGAVDDGTTNCNVALQNWINVGQQGIKLLFEPVLCGGFYLITTALSITVGVNIQGGGWERSALLCVGCDGFQIAAGVAQVIMQNFRINQAVRYQTPGGVVTPNSFAAIRNLGFTGTQNTEHLYRDLFIDGFGTYIVGGGLDFSLIDNCQGYFGLNGIICTGLAANVVVRGGIYQCGNLSPTPDMLALQPVGVQFGSGAAGDATQGCTVQGAIVTGFFADVFLLGANFCNVLDNYLDFANGYNVLSEGILGAIASCCHNIGDNYCATTANASYGIRLLNNAVTIFNDGSRIHGNVLIQYAAGASGGIRIDGTQEQNNIITDNSVQMGSFADAFITAGTGHIFSNNQWLGLGFSSTVQVLYGTNQGIVQAAPALSFTTPTSTALVTSRVTLTNGAGASAGTITNAPTAGNPTKWIPINDNGVIRNIPAW